MKAVLILIFIFSGLIDVNAEILKETTIHKPEGIKQYSDKSSNRYNIEDTFSRLVKVVGKIQPRTTDSQFENTLPSTFSNYGVRAVNRRPNRQKRRDTFLRPVRHMFGTSHKKQRTHRLPPAALHRPFRVAVHTPTEVRAY